MQKTDSSRSIKLTTVLMQDGHEMSDARIASESAAMDSDIVEDKLYMPCVSELAAVLAMRVDPVELLAHANFEVRSDAVVRSPLELSEETKTLLTESLNALMEREVHSNTTHGVTHPVTHLSCVTRCVGAYTVCRASEVCRRN